MINLMDQIKKEMKVDKHKVLPGTKRKQVEVDEVPKSEILKRQPKLPSDGSNPSPVFYKGGVIYTSRSVKKFRALRRRGDKYSEKASGWTAGCHKTMSAAWKSAVNSIDEYKKGVKKK